MRRWFQACRRLPEFSYIDAIDRLEGWAKRSDQVDAYYYLYILHFLRWHAGAERDENAMRANLDKCRQRSIGKRGLSYEWLAEGPTWCPLAHASELGEWKEFFRNTKPLAWATGSIESLKPQAGRIRLGPQTLAHFIPGPKFSEAMHLNSLVKFYLGFSYEGLRAWEVDFLSENVKATLGTSASLALPTSSAVPAVIVAAADSQALTRSVETAIQDQLTNADNRGTVLHVAVLDNKLLDKFGRPPIHERLGFKDIHQMLHAIPSIEVQREGDKQFVKRMLPVERRIAVRAARVPVPTPASPAKPMDLRQDVLLEIQTAIRSAHADSPLTLPALGILLSNRFGSPPTYQRLGFQKLRGLVDSFKEFTVDAGGYVRHTDEPSE